jgi:putative Ca2+/H+ antiporter (TMEM165/GDT1 family)
MTLSGQYIAALLPSAAKLMLVAFALLMAAVELAWPNKRSFIKEPTRSLVASGLVLFVRQIGDGSRFLIFAFAAGSGTPWFAAVGGALGGIGAVLIGWLMADDLVEKLPLRKIRLVIAALLFVAAIITGLSARGLL